MAYYNTTHEEQSVADAELRNCNRQEASILILFRERPSDLLSPWDVAVHVPFPITSVRRAISDMSDRGLLVKTTTKKQGPYGKSSYCWRLAKPKYVQSELNLTESAGSE